MAAGILPEIGTKFGPCKGVCDHTDCALTRTMANASCTICGKSIGYGVRFYKANKEDNLKWFGNAVSIYGTVVKGEQYGHAVCIEQKHNEPKKEDA